MSKSKRLRLAVQNDGKTKPDSLCVRLQEALIQYRQPFPRGEHISVVTCRDPGYVDIRFSRKRGGFSRAFVGVEMYLPLERQALEIRMPRAGAEQLVRVPQAIWDNVFRSLAPMPWIPPFGGVDPVPARSVAIVTPDGPNWACGLCSRRCKHERAAMLCSVLDQYAIPHGG